MPNARSSGAVSNRLVTLSAALVLGAAGAAPGQSQQPAPYTKPMQVRPNLPEPLGDELDLRVNPGLAREGTFVSNARGQAVKGKSGRMFFVFDPDRAGRTLPPMVLLPNPNLATMERLISHTPPGTRLGITGQVTVYQGLNYLLATAPPVVLRVEEPAAAPPPPPPAPSNPAPPPSSPAAPDASPTEPGATAPAPVAEGTKPDAAPAPETTPTDEPSIDEIVAKLDKAAGRVAATAPQRSNTSIPGLGEAGRPEPEEAGSGGAARALVAPGVIAGRRGRIMRAADGAMVFVFDSGVDGGAPRPMVLLPCQNLTAVEQIAERAGEGATYTVSGEVMTYRGQNYMLLRSYQANRVGDQVMPTQ